MKKKFEFSKLTNFRSRVPRDCGGIVHPERLSNIVVRFWIVSWTESNIIRR